MQQASLSCSILIQPTTNMTSLLVCPKGISTYHIQKQILDFPFLLCSFFRFHLLIKRQMALREPIYSYTWETLLRLPLFSFLEISQVNLLVSVFYCLLSDPSQHHLLSGLLSLTMNSWSFSLFKYGISRYARWNLKIHSLLPSHQAHLN